MAKWEKTWISLPDSTQTEAMAPVIISASRATDIPGYFGDWFMDRLGNGYLEWKNRFNGKTSFVSFQKTRLIVFWTKNPLQFMRHLDKIDKLGVNYYFQVTVNDYEKEGLEPGLPPLTERISAFIRLSEWIGKEKVIWRFDPIILSDDISLIETANRITRIAELLKDHARRLVVSFCDISGYAHVAASFRRKNLRVHEASPQEAQEAGEFLAGIRERTGLVISACAEPFDLGRFGVQPNKCIDDNLIRKLFHSDKVLMDFLEKGGDHKDPGQRKLCGCVMSKDIGTYATCKSGCVYCYAARPED